MDGAADLFGPPPVPTPRGTGVDDDGVHLLFFALQPPVGSIPELSDRTKELFNRFKLLGEPQDADRLHLTVATPGKHVREREPFLAALEKSLEGFRGPAIDVVLDRAMLFGAIGGQSLVLLGDDKTQQAIGDLRSGLADAQWHSGIRASRAKTSAHVTVAHVDHVPGMPTGIEPIRFVATRLRLMATYPGGHLHRVVAEWPLDL